MTSDLLQFGSHRFAYNPHTLTVETDKKLTVTTLVDHRRIYQKQGYQPMVVTGEGRLVGEDLMAQFVALQKLLLQSDSQLLSLPGLSPFYCYFTRLKIIGRAGPQFLTYQFAFLEDTERAKSAISSDRHLVVGQGQTLATVAALYGVSVETLITLNPTLAGRIELAEGTVVWLHR